MAGGKDKKAVKAEQKATKAETKKKVDSDDEVSAESEEEKPAKKDKKADKKVVAKKEEKKPAKKQESDSDESEEEKPAKKADKKKPAKKEESESEEEAPAAVAADEDEEEEEDTSSKKRKASDNGASDEKRTKTGGTIFMGGVSDSVNDDKVRELFADCGEITGIRWMVRDGAFKGCGWIDFDSEEGVTKALEFDGADFEGRSLRIDKATPKRENNDAGARKNNDEPSNTVFIGNIPNSAGEDEVLALFEGTTAPTSHRFATDRESGAFKGYGWFDFEDVASAQSAIDHLQGKSVGGQDIRANFAAPRKEGGGGGFGGRGGGRGGFGGGRGGGGRGGFGGGGRGGGGRGGFGGGGRGGFGGRGGGGRGGGFGGGRGGGRGGRGGFSGQRTTF